MCQSIEDGAWSLVLLLLLLIHLEVSLRLHLYGLCVQVDYQNKANYEENLTRQESETGTTRYDLLTQIEIVARVDLHMPAMAMIANNRISSSYVDSISNNSYFQ